jgi:hypothetical protein
VIARIVGERLSKGWGQQVLIENRPGGGTPLTSPTKWSYARNPTAIHC